MNPRSYDIVYTRPGQLRIRGVSLWGNTDLTGRIHDVLMEIPGVDSVSINPVTGTLSVECDPAEEPVVVACVREQLPEGSELNERHESRELAESSGPAAHRPTREEAQARASNKRRVATGVAAALFVAGFVARRLLMRR